MLKAMNLIGAFCRYLIR